MTRALYQTAMLSLVACAAPQASGPAAVPAPPPPESDGPLDIGQAWVAAETKMTGVDGRKLSIAEAKGAKGTLVVFTCNHCPWAKAWEERIVELGNDFVAQGGGAIAINPNDPNVFEADHINEMKVRATKRGMRFPYVVDATSSVARAYGASKTPEVFLFDAQDKLVYYGAVDDNAEEPAQVENRYLADAIGAVVAGQPVKIASTKAIGCSIKFRPGS